MSSDYQVILDVCVYLPRWTEEILDETKRTLEIKLGLTAQQTAHLFPELEIHFADAWVKGYESIIPAMTNHPKDRFWPLLSSLERRQLLGST